MAMAAATTWSHGVQVSALDERQYRSILLPNGLRALLVSDPATEKAAAAMDVHVGHQSDPEALPGLAHFLEHMLFLGTRKFPDENSYKQFLSAHSGRSNASTSPTHTNFYFDVLGDHLHEALDRFAQFFVAPLFTASAAEREMNAVDAENAKNLQNDHRRLYQLQKALANPDHAFHKFGTGNLETLGTGPAAKGVDVRATLLEFYETYYSASVMKLVVYGKEDLGTLEQWAIELFSPIRTTGRTAPTFGDDVAPYDEPRLARAIHVSPVKNLRIIDVSWPLPPLYADFRTKPSKILSHLIGHEGQGSVLSLLKAKKWANGLSAGLSRDHEDWALFSVKVDATDAGIAHTNEVVAVIYAYLRMLREAAPFEPWIFQETQDLAALEFRFKSKESPANYASYLAGAMQRYPPEYAVSGAYLLYEYDAGRAQEVLDALVPERMRLTVVSKRFEGATTSTERWYGTPYSEARIEDDLLQKWSSGAAGSEHQELSLHLPHRNEFICTDFSIATPPRRNDSEAFATPPELVRHDAQCRLWYKPDTQFRKPKMTLSFLLHAPSLASTPHHAVLTSLLIRYLKDELTECSYDAELAGMEYEISFNARAVELYVGGFSHKLPLLLSSVLDRLARMTIGADSFAFSEAVFERVKDRTTRMYENFFLEEPYQHCVYSASLLLEANKWSVDAKLRAVHSLSLHDLVAHARLVFHQVFIESLFYGNLTRESSLSLMESVTDVFKPCHTMFASQLARARVVQLTDGDDYRYERRAWSGENLNSAVCALFQLDTESLELRATLELFAHIAKEPCFNTLRTQEQLGYLVFSGIMRTEGVEYFRVLIQSKVASPALVDQRVELFLVGFRQLLAQMTAREWAQHVNAVVKALREKPKRESEECMRAWREIANETYCFDRREQVASRIATLHIADILDFFDRFIGRCGDKRSKMTVGIYGAKHELADIERDTRMEAGSARSGVGLAAAFALQSTASITKDSASHLHVIRDVDVFKHSMPLFPERARGVLPRGSSAAGAKL
jgi:insulysin